MANTYTLLSAFACALHRKDPTGSLKSPRSTSSLCQGCVWVGSLCLGSHPEEAGCVTVCYHPDRTALNLRGQNPVQKEPLPSPLLCPSTRQPGLHSPTNIIEALLSCPCENTGASPRSQGTHSQSAKAKKELHTERKSCLVYRLLLFTNILKCNLSLFSFSVFV